MALLARHSAYRDLARGRYLTALRRLDTDQSTPASNDWLCTVRLWGQNAVDPWAGAWPFAGGSRARPAGTLAAADPEAVVADAMATHRVVVLMEAHRWPETRYFGVRLLAALRAAGATHLAFETALQGPLDRFLRTGVCRPDSAVCAFDPSRAALLRAARTAGLRLVAFDVPAGGHLRAAFARVLGRRSAEAETVNQVRERSMAEMIIARIVRRDPAAKVVVWTGEQHASKGGWPNSPWRHPFMAAHLARLLGEDPFCLGQVCVDWPELTSGPRLLGNGHPWLRAYGVDAIVLHHRGPSPVRPAWLDRGRIGREVATNGAALLQALPAPEGPAAVPVEQWLVHGPTQQIWLPPGRYLLRGRQGTDHIAWQHPLIIGPLA